MIGDDAEEVVFQILMADAAVVAMIGDENAHENIIPFVATLPAIAYMRSGTEYNPTIHSSAQSLQEVSIDIGCVGRSAKEARALRKLVEAIVTTDWVKVGCSAIYDIDSENHQQILTVTVTEQ